MSKEQGFYEQPLIFIVSTSDLPAREVVSGEFLVSTSRSNKLST